MAERTTVSRSALISHGARIQDIGPPTPTGPARSLNTEWHSPCSVEANLMCQEGITLLARYSLAVETHAEAVRRRSAKIGTCSLVEYQQLKRASDAARKQAETARLTLVRHLAIHRCDSEEKVMTAGGG